MLITNLLLASHIGLDNIAKVETLGLTDLELSFRGLAGAITTGNDSSAIGRTTIDGRDVEEGRVAVADRHVDYALVGEVGNRG